MRGGKKKEEERSLEKKKSCANPMRNPSETDSSELNEGKAGEKLTQILKEGRKSSRSVSQGKETLPN